MIEKRKILKQFKPEIDFDSHDDFIESFSLDSLDIIQLTATIEEKFSVTINDQEMIPENFVNFQKISELIERAKKEKSQ